MRRFGALALAVATFAAPLATTGVAAADPPRYHRDWDGDWDRDHDDRRDERRAYREGYRDGWDQRAYNGYYYRDQWRYGPPPAYYRGDVRYAWRDWRRGEVLPGYYRDRYAAVDWRRERLRPPPRGCRYIRDDRGDYLLVGIATGVILGVIFSDY